MGGPASRLTCRGETKAPVGVQNLQLSSVPGVRGGRNTGPLFSAPPIWEGHSQGPASLLEGCPV